MIQKISLILRIIIAIIYIQTLYFKFSGQPESVYIFKQLGCEPFGRIGSGIIELIIAILILIPKTKLLAAIMSVFVISGAVFSHLFILGIEINNDGGTLFVLGVIVLILSLLIVLIDKNKLLNFNIKQFRIKK